MFENTVICTAYADDSIFLWQKAAALENQY